jgi:biopolymer transport protein ExbD
VYRKKRPRKPRRQVAAASLTITSLMDTMTIILVFLLMNFGSDDVQVEGSDDLHLPTSTADVPGRFTVNVVVSRRSIAVDGDRVIEIERATDPATGAETFVVPDMSRLADALRRKAGSARPQTGPDGEQKPDVREVLLQVDRRMPFSVIREVMAAAGDAGFGSFRFVVISTTAG